MQLLCNGVFVDLYADTRVQFTQDNPLFAFDSLKCERTTQFKLPCTPTNERLFELARIPAYIGTAMRRKFDAQLQDGQVIKDGYLYVSAYDGKDYAAVFVTGEFLGLQAIKKAGKISEIMEFDEMILSPYVPKPSSDGTFETDIFAAFMYSGESGTTILPSINLGVLIERLCTHINAQCTIPAETYKMRIVVPELVAPPENKNAHIHSTRTDGNPINIIYPDELQRLTTEEVTVSAPIVTRYRKGQNNPVGEIISEDTQYVGIRFFKCLNDIVIKFPENFPYNYFLMGITDNGLTYFVGDYSFAKTITSMGDAQAVITGTPLAGRDIEIDAGRRFILVTPNDLTASAVNTIIQIDDEPVPVTATKRGWECTNGLNYDFSVELATNNDSEIKAYRLQDNLPDYTLTDLLKYIAAELGKQLNYTDADGVTFDDLNFETWNVLNIFNIIERGEVKRQFMEYGQNNLVKYKDDSAFLPSDKSPENYAIYNDNLKAEVVLIELGWTNGGFSANSSGVVTFDRLGRKEFLEIRRNDGGYNNATRAYVTKNENLQALCDESTQIQVSARMTLYEYNQITPKTLIYVDGTLYVWTSQQWQNNAAKFTLAKIP